MNSILTVRDVKNPPKTVAELRISFHDTLPGGLEADYETSTQGPKSGRLVRFRASCDPDTAKLAIASLKALYGPTGDDLRRKAVLRLMGGTGRAKRSDIGDEILLADLIRVSAEFPGMVIREVVLDWYKRPGEEGIFTPTSAEFYQALCAKRRELRLIEIALQRIVDGPSREETEEQELNKNRSPQKLAIDKMRAIGK